MGVKKNKLVSVIVPVYNTGEFLGSCLNSLLAQNYSPIEIILVDDGSTDNSSDICNEYALKHKNIHVIHQENRGVSTARNKALDIAKGEYITFCDSDDYVLPNMINHLVEIMEENNCDLSVCGFSRDTELNVSKSNIGIGECKKLHGEQMGIEVLLNRQCAGYSWNKLFKKEYIFSGKPLKFQHDIAVLEDLLFVVEYLSRIKYMCFTPIQLYIYRDNPNGACKQSINDRKLSSIMARERIYDIIESNYGNSTSGQAAWNQLMRCYVYYFKDLLKCHSIENRSFWINYINSGFKKYKNRYELNSNYSNWTKKAKIYFAMLNMYSKIK